MTSAEKRALLRKYMDDCPACSPEDEETIADGDLDGWLTSHDKGWRDRVVPLGDEQQ